MRPMSPLISSNHSLPSLFAVCSNGLNTDVPASSADV
jgi:hypothetical protein